jgi:hypothetical protein
MKAIIYSNQVAVNEFDNLEEAYSFTFGNKCDSVEVIGEGVYTIEEFQTAYSNNEF